MPPCCNYASSPPTPPFPPIGYFSVSSPKLCYLRFPRPSFHFAFLGGGGRSFLGCFCGQAVALPVPQALYAVCGLSLPEHCALAASRADVQSNPAAAIEVEAEAVRALLKVRGV